MQNFVISENQNISGHVTHRLYGPNQTHRLSHTLVGARVWGAETRYKFGSPERFSPV